MSFRATILMTGFVTHDVKRFVISRPEGLDFEPGQGVELTIDAPGWRDQPRPFTPTSLSDDRVLEFTIKGYPEHHGMTEKLHTLQAGDALLVSEPFGTISYQGSGTFIAAGAGITPFLAILRQLARQGRLAGHHLLFSNKTPADIIDEAALRFWLGPRAHFLCSRESDCRCLPGRIDQALLEQAIDDFGQHFYICGPPPFVKAVTQALENLGAKAEAVVFEK